MTPDLSMTFDDSAARREALDPARSFIVQAPAGAGKTELLIQRYLSLLAVVDAPEDIVAITFTRKAAGEMRARVIDALDAARGEAPVEEHRRVTWELAVRALRRDAALGWRLLHAPARMRMLTIDAFNGRLARMQPWIAGIGGHMGVTDDAMELYREAARAVLHRVSPRLRARVLHLLVHLDNRYDSIEERLAALLAVRDQWRRMFSDESLLTRESMEQALQGVIHTALHTLRVALPAELAESLPVLARHAAEELATEDTRDALDLRPCLHVTELPGDNPEALPQWLGIATLLLTRTDTLRSAGGVTKRIGFPSKHPLKQRLLDCLDLLASRPEVHASLVELRRLPSATFTDAEWEILAVIADLALAAADELEQIFVHRAAVDHVQVATAALRALGEDLAPSELALLLEHRIQHILVDEFQDTSVSQYTLLERLTAGWAADDGHSLFLVGDPMQSIYRFREAEVGLFLRCAEDRRLGSVPLAVLRLSRNFRSVEPVVRWVNAAFERMLPRENDIAVGAVSFAACAAVHERASSVDGVYFQPLFNATPDDEARHVVDCIERELAYTDADAIESIAVLVRARSHLARIAAELRARGLGFRAVDIEPLSHHASIRDVLALTMAVLHAGDELSLLAVLRGPLCGCSLETLLRLRDMAEPGGYGEAARRALDSAHLSHDEGTRLRRVLDVLDRARDRRGALPLREMIEGSWLEAGGAACTDERGLAAAAAFFDVLEGCDDGGDITDLAEVLRRVDALFVPPDPSADGRISLMTVHKSKGLQFDTVILPRLEARTRTTPPRLLEWMYRARSTGMDFIMAPVSEQGAAQSPILSWMMNSMKRKDAHERDRALYVASTRARRRLHLSARVSLKEKDGVAQLARPIATSFLHALWPVYGEEMERLAMEQRVETDALESRIEETEQQLFGLPAAWTAPELPAAVQLAGDGAVTSVREDGGMHRAPFRASEAARAVGVTVHAALADIVRNGGVRWWMDMDEASRRERLRVYFALHAPGLDAEALLSDAAEAVTGATHSERGRWLLAQHAEDAVEWELRAVLDGHVVGVVIDRSFVDENGERWIIDYKTSSHEGGNLEAFLAAQEAAYQPQLHRYARIVRMLDQRSIHTALYFPKLGLLREV